LSWDVEDQAGAEEELAEAEIGGGRAGAGEQLLARQERLGADGGGGADVAREQPAALGQQAHTRRVGGGAAGTAVGAASAAVDDLQADARPDGEAPAR